MRVKTLYIQIDGDKLKALLAKYFEMSFSRPFDDLPDYVQEHWHEVAVDFAKDLVEILDIIEE